MGDHGPLVTAAVVCFNHARFLDECLDSISSQDYPDLQMIIIDDCSEDGSPELIQDWIDRNGAQCRFVRHRENQGLCRSLNEALRMAEGKYFAYISTDDAWLPHKLSTQVAVLESSPAKVGLVYGNAFLMNEASEASSGLLLDWYERSDKMPQGQVLNRLLEANFVPALTPLVRKTCLEQAGGWDESLSFEDWDMWLRIAVHFEFVFCSDVLARYRRVQGSLYDRLGVMLYLDGIVTLSKHLGSSEEVDVIIRARLRDYAVLISEQIHSQMGIGRLDTDKQLTEWFSRLFSASAQELAESKRRFLFVFEVICAEIAENGVEIDRLRRQAQAVIAEKGAVVAEKEAAVAEKEAEIDRLERQALDLRDEITRTQRESSRTEFLFQEQVAALQAELQEKQRSLQAVLDSTAWRLTAPLRWAFVRTRRGLGRIPMRPGSPLWRGARLAYRAFPIGPAVKRRFLEYLVSRQILQPVPVERPARILRQEKWQASKPLISVVIPCFNYGRYVADAVDSVVAQTLQDVEIVVVDGGSDDPESIEVLRRLERPRTRVYWRKGRHLVGDNRNFGISLAKGKYVCCLDADDVLRPTYLEKAVYLLETQGYDVVSTSYEFFDEGAGVFTVAERPTLADMVNANHMATCAVFKRSLWARAGGFCDSGTGTDHVPEDWRLWIRFAALGARILNISREHLFLYRIHFGSLSRDSLVPPINKHREAILELESDLLTQSAFSTSSRLQFERVEVLDGTLNLRRGRCEDSRPAVLIALPFMLVGGAERLVSGIAKHLQEQGFRVIFVTHLATDPAHGDTTSWFTPATEEIFHLSRFLDLEHRRDFVFYLLDSRNIDLVWLVGSQLTYDLLEEIRARRPQLKVMDLLFNTVGQTKNNRKQSRWIDINVVENVKVEQWLKARGELAERIRVIPSGVDLSSFRPRPKPDQLIASLGIGRDAFIVGFSGRLSQEKRPDLFIEIAERLKDEPRISFLMTGAGPLSAEVRRQGEGSQLGDRLKLLGTVPDVRDYLSMYDVLVLPSQLDGRPVVVLESLAMGVPVIASRVGGLPDLIDHGKTGYLCEIGDVESFAERIRWLSNHPAELAEMKRAAGKHAEMAFGNQTMNEQYEAVIRELLGLTKSGGASRHLSVEDDSGDALSVVQPGGTDQ